MLVLVQKETYPRRLRAVRITNAVNNVECVAVTETAQQLSIQWARGEISGEAMRSALLAKHSLRQAHPLCDGNTRTIVMMMTFFAVSIVLLGLSAIGAFAQSDAPDTHALLQEISKLLEAYSRGILNSDS